MVVIGGDILPGSAAQWLGLRSLLGVLWHIKTNAPGTKQCIFAATLRQGRSTRTRGSKGFVVAERDLSSQNDRLYTRLRAQALIASGGPGYCARLSRPLTRPVIAAHQTRLRARSHAAEGGKEGDSFQYEEWFPARGASIPRKGTRNLERRREISLVDIIHQPNLTSTE